MTQILEVVANGLRRASVSRRKETEGHIKRAQNHEKEQVANAERRERIRSGIWHDGRIDCVAGSGIISELGVGIERFGDEDLKYHERHEDKDNHADIAKPTKSDDKVWREREYRSEQNVGSLPVVIIKNFGTDIKLGKMEVLNALAEWAADLVSNRVSCSSSLKADARLTVAISIQIAHVIIVSDNRENAKRLAKGAQVVSSCQIGTDKHNQRYLQSLLIPLL